MIKNSVEIINIGTELLLGEIINSNAQFLAKELKEIGLDSYYQSTVGDNEKRIHEVIDIAIKRANILIFTGGLGPTADDLTHESICSFFKLERILDKYVLKKIERKFLSRHIKMPIINIKQAYKPRMAKWIDNKSGTANGIILKIKDRTIITFPGVPSELRRMWSGNVKNYLIKNFTNYCFFSRTLKYTGIGESSLAEKINNYFKSTDPTIAPYAKLGEVQIRIASKARTIKSAKIKVENAAKKILHKTKKYYFASDNNSLESIVSDLLIKNKKTISISESCSGGLLSKRLTDIPGASKYIKLNLVTYSNDSKIDILSVPKNLIREHGAVSATIAKLMAINTMKLAKTNFGFSVTGIAGPGGGNKEKPIGLVYFGFANKNKVKIKKVNFSPKYNREEIRFLASQFALNWIRQELLTSPAR